MGSLKQFAVLTGMAVAVLASPAGIGAASADTLDVGAGGLLSNIGSRNAATHSNQCGSSRVGQRSRHAGRPRPARRRHPLSLQSAGPPAAASRRGVVVSRLPR